jgi:hypothetical protein
MNTESSFARQCWRARLRRSIFNRPLAARARLDARARHGIAVSLAGGAGRLWRRYLLYNLEFVFSDLLEFLGVKRFD